MSVEKTRAEILRLIARVNEGDRAARIGGSAKRRLSAAKTATLGPETAAAGHRAGVADGHLRARRLELTRLKEQREHLATKLSRTPLVDRVTTLEQRLTGVEDRLAVAGGGAAPPSPGQGSPVPPGSVFGGMIRETMLGDMLQLVTSQAMSGVFTVNDDALEILMYFNEGEIYHATTADTKGEDAVFAAIAIQQGSYYFRETSDLPEEKTISANTQFLILEALRRIDEQNAGVAE